MKKFFCLFFLCHVLAWGQNKKLDSLWSVYRNTSQADTNRVKAFHLIIRSYCLNNPDTAIILAKEELEFAKGKNLTEHEGHSLYITGLAYSYKSEHRRALEYIEKAKKKFEEANYEFGVSLCYNASGNIYSDLSDYPTSLSFFLKHLAYCEKINNEKNKSVSYVNIATVYQNMNKNDLAMENLRKALKIAEKINDKKVSSACYANIGRIFSDKKQFDTALYYYNKDLKVSIEMNDTRKMANGYMRIGSVFLNKPNSGKAGARSAVEYYQKALAAANKVNYGAGMLLSYLNLSEAYQILGDFKRSISYGDSGLSLSRSTGELDNEMMAYKTLAYGYVGLGKYKEAFGYHEKYKMLGDSIFNAQNSEKLSGLKTQFEVDKKEAELKAQAQAREVVVNEEKKRQQLVIYAGAVFLLLVIVFAVVMFNRFRITKRQKHIIELQKELVEEKQKEIVDSINYARRIQYTLLAHKEFLKENIPEHFVLFKPKDIVSGDFYWATKKGNRFYLAVCDSTGHGVPGAFMSLLNISFLNEAINEKNINAPNEILDHVRQRLIKEISQDGAQDGMDGILICLEKDPHITKCTYAAAYNVPVLVRNGNVIEMSADKIPIGKGEKNDSFTLHSVELKKDDTLYLYTDGYADQFGGPKGKKLKYKTLQEFLVSMKNEPMAKQKEKLEETFENWRGNLEQVDDVCVIGIKI